MARITQEQKYQRRWWTLVVLSLSLVIIGLDNTILNVAIPTLQQELGATASELQWMVNSYILVFAGLLLTMGAIGDRFGRARALAMGLVIFGVASAYAATTETAFQLITARGIMGIGGALIMPATLSIITDVFPRDERAKAIGIWAAVAGLGIGLGPVVGGALLQNFWWGSVFLINVPIVIGALIAGYYLVPASRDPEATPLDIPGAVTSMIAVSALVYGIIEGPERGWTSSHVVVAAAVFLIAGTSFLRIERRTDHPIAIGIVIGSATAHRLAARVGTAKVVSFGLFILAAVLTGFTFFDVGTSYAIIGPAIVLMAYGMGNIMAPATDAVMGAVPVAKAGVASATNDVTRQVAGAIGVATIGSVFNSVYSSSVADAVSQLPPEAAGIAQNNVGAAIQIGAQLPEPVGTAIAEAARQGFIDAMGPAVFVAVGMALVGAVWIRRFMPAQHLGEQEQAEAFST